MDKYRLKSMCLKLCFSIQHIGNRKRCLRRPTPVAKLILRLTVFTLHFTHHINMNMHGQRGAVKILKNTLL